MSRDTEYQFVDTDAEVILSRLVSAYENITGHTLRPADPDRLFLSWVASIIVQERVSQNYTGNQNIPSRAEGSNLDALGEWIYSISRLAAQPSRCTVRFTISAVQTTAIAVPNGTRVTDASGTLVWHTTEDALVPIGALYVDVPVICETTGAAGNGYVAGQINTLIDVDNILYYASCSNLTTSEGGSDEATDDEYYELMREGLDSYSTAGPTGAYIYWAKTVSTSIADVKAIQPRETLSETVNVYTDADSVKHAFLAGEYLLVDELSVYAHGGQTPATLGTDYTYTYVNGLLDIKIKSLGTLTAQTKLDVSFGRIKPGNVYLYALMDDGSLADAEIKSAILETCSADTVRPLTDFVSCHDAELVPYNVNVTFYIQRYQQKSVAEITAAVNDAVNKYVEWQREKIGRDINPSKLEWFLEDTGIKRCEIASPIFTALRNGDDHTVPQVASVAQITITNGGYEDE